MDKNIYMYTHKNTYMCTYVPTVYAKFSPKIRMYVVYTYILNMYVNMYVT